MKQILYCNRLKELPICLITIPDEVSLATKYFEDFQALFGGRIFDQLDIDDLIKISPLELGKASKVEAGLDETLLIGPENRSPTEQKALDERISFVEAQYNNSDNIKRVLYEERLNRLTGSVSLIRVGGITEIERKEINDKLVDGLNSVKNSIVGGIIPGGGSALVHASRILDLFKLDNEEEQLGVDLMKTVCKFPTKVLCDNAGINGNHIVTQLYEEHQDPWIGFNLKTKLFEDFRETGIFDSFKSLSNILRDSVSTGSIMLTSECMIVNKKRYIPSPLSRYPKEPF